MDIPRARQLADQNLVIAQQLIDALADDTVIIRTPDQFDRALSLAVAGDVLSLAPEFVYPGPARIDKAVTVTNAGPFPMGRMTADAVLPKFLNGLALTNGGILVAVEVQHTNPLTDIVVATGVFTIDQCRVLGDPTRGAKRGIQANPSAASIVWCYIDHCFQASPGNDSQALACWQGGNLDIDDNFLRGGSETLLLGGDDSPTAATMAHDITIRHNTITANPAWMGQPIGVKTRVEFKACRNVLMEDNDVEYCWKQGQVGYLLTLNVRNQEGRAPWSTIENVTISKNRLRHGCAALSLLGHDDAPRLSGTMTNVKIVDNAWTDLDPVKYGDGTDRMIIAFQPMKSVALQRNTFEMVAPGSTIYFDGPIDMADAMNVSDNVWPASTYGIFGTAGTQTHDNTPAPSSSWTYFTKNGTLSGNKTV